MEKKSNPHVRDENPLIFLQSSQSHQTSESVTNTSMTVGFDPEWNESILEISQSYNMQRKGVFSRKPQDDAEQESRIEQIVESFDKLKSNKSADSEIIESNITETWY